MTARTGSDVNEIGRPEEDAFLERMRVEEHQRQEFAEAFVRETPALPHVADLVDVQRKHADQISRLRHSVGRLQRILIIMLLLSGSVVVTLLALATFLYLRPDVRLSLIGETASDTGTANRAGVEAQLNRMPDYVIESNLPFEIRTDVDRKHQLIIRQLYNNAMTIRRPSGAIEARNVATRDYIQYMADVSLAIEQASADEASTEILRALVNLALIGPELRKVERRMDLNIATQDRLDQIRAVLRARDVRSSQLSRILE
jgi:hypothetical protein